jgi:uncharacterized HAD superfamily protein
MKIGIELSGVVLDLLGAAIEYFGEPQQKEASTFEEMFPMISDSSLSAWISSGRTCEEMSAVDGALWAIDKLSQNHEIHGITSMGKHLITATANWILRNSVAITSVSHTSNKDVRAKQSKIDIFIESDAMSARKISNVCRTIILDSPYNRFGAGKKVERAYSWKEILEMIDEGT